MLLACLIPRCSSTSGCSTQVLKFPLWESPLDSAWLIGTGVLCCRATSFSNYGWESWIYRCPLKHPQTKTEFKIFKYFLTPFCIVLLLIYSLEQIKVLFYFVWLCFAWLCFAFNNNWIIKFTIVGRKSSNNSFAICFQQGR